MELHNTGSKAGVGLNPAPIKEQPVVIHAKLDDFQAGLANQS